MQVCSRRKCQQALRTAVAQPLLCMCGREWVVVSGSAGIAREGTKQGNHSVCRKHTPKHAAVGTEASQDLVASDGSLQLVVRSDRICGSLAHYASAALHAASSCTFPARRKLQTEAPATPGGQRGTASARAALASMPYTHSACRRLADLLVFGPMLDLAVTAADKAQDCGKTTTGKTVLFCCRSQPGRPMLIPCNERACAYLQYCATLHRPQRLRPIAFSPHPAHLFALTMSRASARRVSSPAAAMVSMFAARDVVASPGACWRASSARAAAKQASAPATTGSSTITHMLGRTCAAQADE